MGSESRSVRDDPCFRHTPRKGDFPSAKLRANGHCYRPPVTRGRAEDGAVRASTADLTDSPGTARVKDFPLSDHPRANDLILLTVSALVGSPPQ